MLESKKRTKPDENMYCEQPPKSEISHVRFFCSQVYVNKDLLKITADRYNSFDLFKSTSALGDYYVNRMYSLKHTLAINFVEGQHQKIDSCGAPTPNAN